MSYGLIFGALIMAEGIYIYIYIYNIMIRRNFGVRYQWIVTGYFLVVSLSGWISDRKSVV